jgi:hypothetical protein
VRYTPDSTEDGGRLFEGCFYLFQSRRVTYGNSGGIDSGLSLFETLGITSSQEGRDIHGPELGCNRGPDGTTSSEDQNTTH